jgi:AmiR/NasT family two-component response regulator
LYVAAVPLSPVDQRAQITQLQERVDQLQTALDSRVAIEQAKGVLMERFALTPGAAFELLRRAARNNRESLHTLAALVTAARTTPPEIDVLMRNRRTERLNGS